MWAPVESPLTFIESNSGLFHIILKSVFLKITCSLKLYLRKRKISLGKKLKRLKHKFTQTKKTWNVASREEKKEIAFLFFIPFPNQQLILSCDSAKLIWARDREKGGTMCEEFGKSSPKFHEMINLFYTLKNSSPSHIESCSAEKAFPCEGCCTVAARHVWVSDAFRETFIRSEAKVTTGCTVVNLDGCFIRHF